MKETIKTVNLNRALDIRGKVKQLTGFSEDELNLMTFDFAVDYCKAMGMSEEWLGVWLREPLFWGWWKQQWTLVDEVFWYKFYINANKPELVQPLRDRYRALHRSIDKFPDNVVYEKIHNSYEVASNQIIKKITAKHQNL
jgi:hypothetical protein